MIILIRSSLQPQPMKVSFFNERYCSVDSRVINIFGSFSLGEITNKKKQEKKYAKLYQNAISELNFLSNSNFLSGKTSLTQGHSQQRDLASRPPLLLNLMLLHKCFFGKNFAQMETFLCLLLRSSKSQ